MSFDCFSFTLPLALLSESVGEDTSRPVLYTSSEKTWLWSVALLLAPAEEEISSLQESGCFAPCQALMEHLVSVERLEMRFSNFSGAAWAVWIVHNVWIKMLSAGWFNPKNYKDVHVNPKERGVGCSYNPNTPCKQVLNTFQRTGVYGSGSWQTISWWWLMAIYRIDISFSTAWSATCCCFLSSPNREKRAGHPYNLTGFKFSGFGTASLDWLVLSTTELCVPSCLVKFGS